MYFCSLFRWNFYLYKFIRRDEEIINQNQFVNCKYILDLNSFDEEMN